MAVDWLIITLCLYDTNTPKFAVSGRFLYPRFASVHNSQVTTHDSTLLVSILHPYFTTTIISHHCFVLCMSTFMCSCSLCLNPVTVTILCSFVYPIRTVCYPYYHCLCSDTYMLPIIAISVLCALQAVLDDHTTARRGWAFVFLRRQAAQDERQRTEETANC